MRNGREPPKYPTPTVEYREIPPIPVKEIQKMANTAVAMWKRGLPVYRSLTALRLASTVAFFDHRIPTNLQWISDFFEERSWLFEPFNLMNIQIQGKEEATLNAALSFSVFKALELSDTPSWFEIEPDLMYALLATKLKGVLPSDVKLPLPGFFIAFPPGVVSLLNEHTGEHEVRAMSLAEGHTRPKEELETNLAYLHLPDGMRHGRRLLFVCYCEPNERSTSPVDDNLVYFSLPLYDGEQTIEELVEYDRKMAGPDNRDDQIGGTIAGKLCTNLEIRTILRSFAINFSLYLSSPESDVRHKNSKRIQELRKGKGKKSRRNQDAIKRLQNEPFWVVGSRVVIDPSVRESLRGTGKKTGKQQAVNVTVIGYWRRQWRGPKTPDKPKGQECYQRWIEPTVRNRVEGASVLGHEYKVKGTKKQ